MFYALKLLFEFIAIKCFVKKNYHPTFDNNRFSWIEYSIAFKTYSHRFNQ